MSKLSNIIQRRELEPLLLKAFKIITHYKKASDCPATVMGSDEDIDSVHFCSMREKCLLYTTQKIGRKSCHQIHMKAVEEAKTLRGSNIYLCPESLVFWTSPFFAGERFAGALISGGITGTKEDNGRVRALANMLLIYADKISSVSYVQKNITTHLKINKNTSVMEEAEEKDSNNQKSENNTHSIDMERILLASLRRGDNAEAKKNLLALLNILYKEVKHNLPAFRLKALELAVLLSRAAADHARINNNTILDINNRYLKKIEESSSYGEITEVIASFTENISENIFSFHGVRHFSAIKKAERFIWENYTRKLSLCEIAKVSGLSAPYFSTIFKEEMGENLSNYLNRLRVEKAAAILTNTNMPISEIARVCGFEDQSWFSKIFKNNTGLTPGKYRDQGNISGVSE